jgi:hypothetical protein
MSLPVALRDHVQIGWCGPADLHMIGERGGQ